MDEVILKREGRNLERISIFTVTIVLGLLFYDLFTVLKRDFAEVPQRLNEGSMVNLNDPDAASKIGTLLTKGFYFEDSRDVTLITSSILKGLADIGEIDNIGEINKNRFAVNADQAFTSGGESLKKRAKLARTLLGYTGVDSIRFTREKRSPPQLPAINNLGKGVHSITGVISQKEKPLEGVLVRLQLILPQDSLYSFDPDADSSFISETPTLRQTFVLDSVGKPQLQSLDAYARTDQNGSFTFSGLQENKAYEVLPLQPGYQFGPAKGVVQLTGDQSFNFFQSPHLLKLFSAKDFNNLKREGSLIVRTPSEVSKWYIIIAAVFFFLFILLHIFLSAKFPGADQLIVPVVMLLTGLSLITLLSLQDPLRDRFLAKSTLFYFVGGFAGLFILMLFNLRKFTVDSGLFRMFIFKGKRGARGWQWALLALGLLVMTIFLGTGPEGSGVKVNLFGFQPSEAVKFFIVIFLAGFLSSNEKFISEYATVKKRWSFFSFALIAILAAIFLFLMLGDLGPAIVVCFAFIILFSFSRGDFGFMVGAVVIYVLANWILKNDWLAAGVTVGLLLLAMLFIRKQLSESSVMALVVIAGFLLIDQIPYLEKLFPGPVHRLVDRKAIWQDNWNNEVFGGDQVANGIWGMASGGISGQGVGEGFAKTIPEAHTDMILPSLGEDLGWAGILCIFILFLVFLHRSIVIGRQTGTPFLFYLCSGIGVVTFVQFLLIAGGSTGALPLSGVSLPFISYGGSSLICNLLAAGFLLSASVIRGSKVQMNYISKQQDRNLIPALIAASIGVILLSVNVSRYLFNNKTWVVKPALVADRSGARMFSYNPRINILISRLQAGELYDRHNRLLATSNSEMLQTKADSLRAAGLLQNDLDSLTHKRLERYYPYGAQTFFWTGDANTNIFQGATNGFFAEYALDAELRGFKAPAESFSVMATKFREDRFLPPAPREMIVTKKDYRELAVLLLAGINSDTVKAFKKRNRDVHLSIDANLQVALQRSLPLDDSLIDNRVSVVVIDDQNGDVLASAAWPLPPVTDWEKMNLTIREQNKLMEWMTLTDIGFTYATQPGSTAKIATTMAAFNKLGDSAKNRRFVIRQGDLIRTKGFEPDEAGNITMERAFVRSNNAYFIKLANEEKLQEEMATLYMRSGMFLRGAGGYYYQSGPIDPDQEDSWRALWRRTEFMSLRSYNPNNLRRTRGRGVSGMSWGQGELIATPAAVARLASSVSNKGLIVPHRFVLKISDSTQPVKQGVKITEQHFAEIINDLMRKQSANKKEKLGIVAGGKTGTPERIWHGERINDGWYVFFAPKANGNGHIVTCIRIEKTKGSSDAVKAAGKHVIPELLKRGYIKSFEPIKPVKNLTDSL